LNNKTWYHFSFICKNGTVMEEVPVMDLYTILNPQQKEAVALIEGPLLVLAGAGSGKTRVVTTRIVKLLEIGIAPSKILGVTFTNKAAQEMKDRVNKLTNSHVLICTFHSLGARILRESIFALGYSRDFNIYDEDDAEKLLKVCLAELEVTDKKMEPKIFKRMISQAKNELQSPEDFQRPNVTDAFERLFPLVYALYQRKLKEYNSLDFDDLLYLPIRLFQEHPTILEHYQDRWSFLLIDEYQDTNAAQYKLVRLLVEKSQNIFAVGDPDQSIYSWRGANINNILNFEKDYPGAKVIRLEQNYRSHTNILDAANALIRHNHNRFDKNLWSDLGPGEKIKYISRETERAEAEFVVQQLNHHHVKEGIPLNEMVIFYRTNFQSRPFEDVLLQHRIPYVIVGGISFYQRREIKDILAFLRMIQSGVDFVSFARTINLPKRGFGDTTIEKIRIAAYQSNLSIVEYSKALVEDRPVTAPIKLSAKQKEGLQDYVNTLQELKNQREDVSIAQLIKYTIERIGYLKFLDEDQETVDDRKENLNELVSKAAEWESLDAEDRSLAAFLEELSLKTTLDEANDSRMRLNLMTIHNGKGLEFKVVFLVGMEEGLFPHANVFKENMNGLEEERRLCYVGMTRAKELLYMSSVNVRYLWGTSRAMPPSRFFKEIPSEYIEKPKSSGSVSYARKAKMVEDYEEDFIDDIDQTKPVIAVKPYSKPLSKPLGKPGKIEEPTEPLEEGEAIYHAQFGIGIIQRVYQGSAGITYEILFSKDHAKRNIVAKYADLKRL